MSSTTTAATAAGTRTRLLIALAAVVALLVGAAAPSGAEEENTQVPLTGMFNNVGIWHDPVNRADFDGGGFSYSGLALRLNGAAPGATISSNGFTYTFPDRPAGTADNVITNGQTLPFANTTGVTKLGFLGASTHGPVTADFTFTYEVAGENGPERKDVKVPVTFSDWTLNAGASSPSARNTIAVTTPVRMAGQANVERVNTHIFSVSVPVPLAVTPDARLLSVTLPRLTSGQIHLFAAALA